MPEGVWVADMESLAKGNFDTKFDGRGYLEVKKLAETNNASLYYIVMTADEDEIEKRIRNRGDVDMIDRALFLKKKLEAMPENQGHIYNNTGKNVKDIIQEIALEQYILP